jgi:hypothetical protein
MKINLTNLNHITELREYERSQELQKLFNEERKKKSVKPKPKRKIVKKKKGCGCK